jgi:hypothetical protein
MAHRLLALLPALLALSCNQVLGIEETTLSTAQPAKTGPWRCVTGKPLQPPSTIPETIKLTMVALSYGDFKPRAGIRFRACANRGDTTCNTVAGEGLTDESGGTQFEVKTIPNQGFTGYIKILDERTEEQKNQDNPPKEFVLFHYFFSNNLYTDLQVPPSVVATQLDVDGLASGAGKPPEAGKNSGLNHISATSIDCDGNAAAGVTFDITGAGGTLPSTAVRWYFNQGSASAVASSTDNVGLGGALFLTTGIEHRIVARNSEGEIVSEGGLLLAPNAFCTMLMLPR